MYDLTILNKWWKNKDRILEDKHIVEFNRKKYKWRPMVLDEISLKIDNIYSIRGPRQVGKTTLIKLIIKNLLERVDGKSIFYWSCDDVLDFRELIVLIRDYLSFSDGIEERYIFLDEISSVKDWQRAIKMLRDSGELKNSSIMLTGSHSLDIKFGFDRLPGRIGKHGKDYLLLPMTFREFCLLINPDLKLAKIKGLSITKIKEAYNKVRLYYKEINDLFRKYLITGGFPLAVNEYFTNKKIPEYVYELYMQWVVGDIVKWGKQEKILKQILRTLITKQGSAISWDSLAKEAEVKSHKTVSEYVELLENMFVLHTAYFIDKSKKIINFDKNKKIYFSDPLIYHICNKIFFFREEEISPSLVESSVISNLFHYYDVSYWVKKKEVDFIVNDKGSLFPIELKYQKNISGSDWKGLYYFKQGLLLTKDYFEEKDKYLAVQVHLFLAML